MKKVIYLIVLIVATNGNIEEVQVFTKWVNLVFPLFTLVGVREERIAEYRLLFGLLSVLCAILRFYLVNK